MTLAESLLSHAGKLLASTARMAPADADLRRAISASYYALFHQLIEDSATLIAPNVSIEANLRIRRWFDHALMKQICGRFLKAKLEQPLLSLIGEAASPELQLVCETFITLQEARIDADYNPGYVVDYGETLKYLAQTADSINAWRAIRDTAEANVFVLSLLMWDNWKKDRK